MLDLSFLGRRVRGFELVLELGDAELRPLALRRAAVRRGLLGDESALAFLLPPTNPLLQIRRHPLALLHALPFGLAVCESHSGELRLPASCALVGRSLPLERGVGRRCAPSLLPVELPVGRGNGAFELRCARLGRREGGPGCSRRDVRGGAVGLRLGGAALRVSELVLCVSAARRWVSAVSHCVATAASALRNAQMKWSFPGFCPGRLLGQKFRSC